MEGVSNNAYHPPTCWATHLRKRAALEMLKTLSSACLGREAARQTPHRRRHGNGGREEDLAHGFRCLGVSSRVIQYQLCHVLRCSPGFPSSLDSKSNDQQERSLLFAGEVLHILRPVAYVVLRCVNPKADMPGITSVCSGAYSAASHGPLCWAP